MKSVLKQVLHFFTKWFKTYTIIEGGDLRACVMYSNNSKEKRTCILFGFNMFNDEPNFGTSDGVDVKDLHDKDFNYFEVLNKSKDSFDVGKIRVQSSSHDALLKTRITRRTIDANGTRTSRPHVLVNSLDAYQQQSGILDVAAFDGSRVDGNTWFDFDLQPKMTIVISVYSRVYKKIGYFEYRKHLRKEEYWSRQFVIQINAIEWIINGVKKIFKKK